MVFAIQIAAVLSVVIFVLGFIRPKWVLFWMKEPDRLWASSLGLLLFMASVTAYSELRLKHRQGQPKQPGQERSLDQRNEFPLTR